MATSAYVKQLIESSPVLTAAERKEWLDLLPFMNDKQQSELLLILQSQADQPSTQTGTSASAPVSASQASAAAVMSEPIVSPISNVSSAHGSIPAQSPVTTTVSAFLNKNFASELHHGSIPGSFQSEATVIPPVQALQAQPVPHAAPALPKVDSVPKNFVPPPQTVVPPMSSFGVIPELHTTGPVNTVVSPVAQKSGGLPTRADTESLASSAPMELREPVIHAQSLEAVRMLNVATLHAQGVLNLETELKTLCGKFGYFSVQFAFEQSPLYQAYIAVGALILKEHQTFEAAQATLASAGRSYLTKPEFEEFSDLIRRLKGHI